MKALFIILGVIIISAIVGNPVAYYLYQYEFEQLAYWCSRISAYTFLGGFVVLLAMPAYYAQKARNDEREARKVLYKHLENR